MGKFGKHKKAEKAKISKEENLTMTAEIQKAQDGGVKKKKYRGKKKKKGENTSPGSGTPSIKLCPPKLKKMGKEDISSNWKSLLQTMVPSELQSSISSKPFHRPMLKRKPQSVVSTVQIEKSEIWFDDVDETLLDKPLESANPEKFLVKEKSFVGLTRIIGMDCEMVGVGRGGEESILARVSIVNHFGNPIFDSFVAPTERVTDYRTHVSGVRPQDLINVPDFHNVQKKVADIIKGRVLVGHALHHDLKVLYLDHPRKLIRDTSKYKPFRAHFGGKTPGLKKLSERYIGVKVQTGEHSSVQDAQAAVRLYTLVRTDWERSIMEKHKGNTRVGKKKPRKELNNKSSQLSGIQKDLSSTGTKQYVDSDTE